MPSAVAVHLATGEVSGRGVAITPHLPQVGRNTAVLQIQMRDCPDSFPLWSEKSASWAYHTGVPDGNPGSFERFRMCDHPNSSKSVGMRREGRQKGNWEREGVISKKKVLLLLPDSPSLQTRLPGWQVASPHEELSLIATGW